MSPLAATATSQGPPNVSGPSPRTPLVPSVMSSSAIGAVLEDLLADAVSRLAVGDPEVAKPIDADAVRPREQLLAPHLEDLAGAIQLDDRRLGAMKRVDLAGGIDRHAGDFAPDRAVQAALPTPGTSRYGLRLARTLAMTAQRNRDGGGGQADSSCGCIIDWTGRP